jgi:hypothetical protein
VPGIFPKAIGVPNIFFVPENFCFYLNCEGKPTKIGYFAILTAVGELHNASCF